MGDDRLALLVQNYRQQGLIDFDFAPLFDEAQFSEFVHALTPYQGDSSPNCAKENNHLFQMAEAILPLPPLRLPQSQLRSPSHGPNLQRAARTDSLLSLSFAEPSNSKGPPGRRALSRPVHNV
jgi:hypothetical protein